MESTRESLVGLFPFAGDGWRTRICFVFMSVGFRGLVVPRVLFSGEVGSMGADFFRGDLLTEGFALVAIRGFGANKAPSSGSSSSDAYGDIFND